MDPAARYRGPPIIDIKPYLKEFGPIGPVEQPEWATVVMDRYYAVDHTAGRSI